MTGPPPNWPYSSQASETYEYDRVLGANGITDSSMVRRRQGRGLRPRLPTRTVSFRGLHMTLTETNAGKITSCARPPVILTTNIIGCSTSQGRCMRLRTTRTLRPTAVARVYHTPRITRTRSQFEPAPPPVLLHETITTRIFARLRLLRQTEPPRPRPRGFIMITLEIRIT